MDMQKFIFHMQKDLIPCHGLDSDIERIELWASILERPEELGETVTYNYFMNKKEIQGDIAKESSDWSTGNYFDAGVDVANLATTLIGPAPASVLMTPTPTYGVDAREVNRILAGFIYGMTG